MKPERHHLILESCRGSEAHGTYVAGQLDDRDVFGIFIPPKEYILGLRRWENWERIEGEWDYVYYSLQKFFSLALKGNPNVLSILYLKPEQYSFLTGQGETLLRARDIFLSRHCYHSFTGYAHGQLKRMQRFEFKGYMGDERKKLVERFGYDPKNAGHMIRLLRMGVELLKTGRLNVWREDRAELLAIKRGEWTVDAIKSEADALFSQAKAAVDTSPLPEDPDCAKAERLLIELTESFWFNEGHHSGQ